MRLDHLLIDLDAEAPVPAIGIGSLTADSRGARPGALFVALAGSRADGAAFARDAVGRGAAAVVAASDAQIDGLSVPVVRVADPRRALAIAAARLAGPQPETIVAVTGTSGKTSVAAFTRQIFQAAGKRAAAIGTTGVVTAEGTRYGSLTTPDPVRLHALLAGLACEGITHAVMEASSHGLDQRRLDGVRLAAGAFTNLSRDHLDYHPSIDAYLAAKIRLFDTLLASGAGAVVDADEPAADAVAAAAQARGLALRTIGRAGTFLRTLSIARDGRGQRVELETEQGSRDLLIPLIGRFQVSNALVAAALAASAGIDLDVALDALAGLVGAPGRLELVGRTGQGAPVFVDYAHKPGALESAIAALRPFVGGRLVVVFGCGGDRDPGKRPLMGEIASRLADVVIVTDDNPRSEAPAAIRAAILAAAPGAREIGDRASAIREGVAMLGEGDLLLVAGKGHETGQIVGDQVLPFSDHEAVLAALAEAGR